VKGVRRHIERAMCRGTLFLSLLLSIAVQAAAASSPTLRPVPAPDTARMEPAVREQLDAARRRLAASSPPTGQPPSAAAEAYGEAGSLYLLYGLFDAAIPALVDAEALAPRDARWPYYLGVAAQQQDDAEAARAALSRALALAPGDVPTLLRLGEIELLADRPEAARERFAAALAAEPGSAAAHAGLGRVALARRDAAAAVEHFSAALAAQPRATSLHAQLAAAYRQSGQLDRARQEASRYAETGGEGRVTFADPRMDRLAVVDAGAKGHAARATRALEAGQLAAAAEEYGKALAAEPGDADAWANLGVARERLGDRPGAEAAYRKAIALAPEAPRPRYNLGTLLAQRGEVKEGIEQLGAAARLAPDWKDARINLATALESRGNAAAALTQYDEILRREPADEIARYRRGLALLALGRAGDAAAELAKVTAAEPAAAEPRAALAAALLRAGRDREARAQLEQGLERAPQNAATDLAAQLVRVLACSEDPAVRDGARALSLAERLLAAGDTPEREALAAMALAELGRLPEAVSRQRRAIETATGAPGGAPPAALARLRAHLASYQAGKPCRSPWKG
jgi:Flp pilus assembly protein TadD